MKRFGLVAAATASIAVAGYVVFESGLLDRTWTLHVNQVRLIVPTENIGFFRYSEANSSSHILVKFEPQTLTCLNRHQSTSDVRGQILGTASPIGSMLRDLLRDQKHAFTPSDRIRGAREFFPRHGFFANKFVFAKEGASNAVNFYVCSGIGIRETAHCDAHVELHRGVQISLLSVGRPPSEVSDVVENCIVPHARNWIR